MTSTTLLLLFLAAADSPCVEVAGGAVLVRDVVAAAPGFASLPADSVLGYAPAPGVRRWIKAPASDTEICIMRALRPVPRERVLAAIEATREARGWHDLTIELVSYPAGPLPEGSIRLDKAPFRPGRNKRDPALLLWQGALEYDRLRTVPFPIEVRISSTRTVAVAAHALARGQAILGGDVRIEPRRVHGLAALSASASFSPVGLQTTRNFAAGEEILPTQVIRPGDVRQGDLVNVTVRSNHAVLRLEAKSLATGRRGDWIVLENPATRRRFRARIEGPGQALLEPSGVSNVN
jgi:flagella basal body P-ring formation protein FlgA